MTKLTALILFAIMLGGCKSNLEKRVDALENKAGLGPKLYVKIEKERFDRLMKSSGWEAGPVLYCGKGGIDLFYSKGDDTQDFEFYPEGKP